MKMNLYHGSNCEFENISLAYSKEKRDFGRGFYTTAIIEQAKEWAEILCQRNGNSKAFLYTFKLSDYKTLKVKKFTEYSKEWLEFVKENRTCEILQHNYDIVIGPVANDRTRETIALYLSGNYDMEYAIKKLSYMKSNNQFSFHTEKSLAKLKFIEKRKWNL